MISGMEGNRSEGGRSPRRSRASGWYFAGFRAGVRGFRLVGPHQIPSEHPPGHTPEGVEWFLGCVAALEQCSATFRGFRTPMDSIATSPGWSGERGGDGALDPIETTNAA